MLHDTTLTTFVKDVDFMVQGFELIEEPLNLKAVGQQWFKSVCETGEHGTAGALVLGATPWLVEYCLERHERVIAVDMSAPMLTRLERLLTEKRPSSDVGRVTLLQCNWTEIPGHCGDVTLVAGDNAFSFLPFAEAWESLCRRLKCHMPAGSRIVTRFCSVPRAHREPTIADIVDQFEKGGLPTCTATRAALLFSCWNEVTAAIDTAEALRRYERNRSLFEKALQRRGVTGGNDLATVEKYRFADATYFAPRLDDALSVFRHWFSVSSVHFGPYPLSSYFPLIDATVR